MVERGLLQAEKGKTPSTQIRNVQLDELASLFRHRPYMGKKKVVVVVDAENMNLNSQNRFLKTLEEPTADTVIVLLSSHPEALLATVRSRCQSLGFGPIDKAQIHAFLMEHYRLEPDRAAALAAMAQGSLGNAGKLAEGKILDTRDQVTDTLAQIRKGNLAGILSSVDELASSREPAEETLNLLELWCRDLLIAVLKLPQQYLANQDCREQILGDAVGVDPRRLLRWMERIRWTRGVLKNNANPRMVMESLFLHMRMH